MKQYLDIVERVLKKGKWKGNRTGIRTLTLPNVCFSHEMSDGFPLLTTKQMATKAIAVELEGFIKGITDKNWYKQRGCNIWNEWANPEAVKEFYKKNYADWHAEYKKQIEDGWIDVEEPPSFDQVKKHLQMSVDDLGPIYGYQWRHFDEHYQMNDGGPDTFGMRVGNDWPVNGVERGADQLKSIVDTLHKNPDDRRMVCSAWNPNQIDLMALPPCHFAWVVTVIDGTINLFWAQRSCDLMLGVPFNIASYALLLCLLAKEANLTPGNLTGMLCDCHIYENHIEGATEQISRTPTELPNINILSKGIFDWTHQDFQLTNYNPQPKITFKVAV